jgi:hypothetical protein
MKMKIEKVEEKVRKFSNIAQNLIRSKHQQHILDFKKSKETKAFEEQ